MKPKRILIIDDEVDIIKVLSIRLRERGFEVDSALSGADGLRHINQNPPDLVILDIMMPGLSGAEVASKLGQSSATAMIPIIFLSALQPKNEENVEGSKGSNIIFAKPYDIDQLVAKINSLLKET